MYVHMYVSDTAAQSTPQAGVIRRTGVRRQSSIGPLTDCPPSPPGLSPQAPEGPEGSSLRPSDAVRNDVHVYCNVGGLTQSRSQPHSVNTLHRLQTARARSSEDGGHLESMPAFPALPTLPSRPVHARNYSRNLNYESGASHTIMVQDVSPQYQNVPTCRCSATADGNNIIERLEEVSNRLGALERGLVTDVRRILALLEKSNPLASSETEFVTTSSSIAAPVDGETVSIRSFIPLSCPLAVGDYFAQ